MTGLQSTFSNGTLRHSKGSNRHNSLPSLLITATLTTKRPEISILVLKETRSLKAPIYRVVVFPRTMRQAHLPPINLNIYPPSTKFVQCLTVVRNFLRKSSPNKDIQTLWKSTSISINLQNDSYNNTKQVHKAFRSSQEDRLKSHLVS